MDKVKDSKTGIPQNCFEIMYKKAIGDGARGHYKMWQTGANAPRATDAQAVRRIHFYVRMGMKTVAASKHILGKPVTIQFRVKNSVGKVAFNRAIFFWRSKSINFEH